MPVEITMPQQSDTMTEGTVVRWLKKEGEKVKAGEIVAEIATDKATTEMEAFDSGTVAVILVKDGQKAPVGAAIAVLATSKETVEEVKKKYAGGGGGGAKATGAPAPAKAQAATAAQGSAPKAQTAVSMAP